MNYSRILLPAVAGVSVVEPLALGEYGAFKPPSSVNVPEQVVKILVPLAGNAYVWARRLAGWANPNSAKPNTKENSHEAAG